jgi:hypothetical protein
MGIIVPWRDVRQKRVPSIDDFHESASEVMRLIGANPRVFKGAAFIGSVARGDVCPRSDLDLIAVAYDGSFTLARGLIRDFDGLARSRGIPLDCQLWPSSVARLGRHAYGPSYLETLPRTSGEYEFGTPLIDCFRVRPGCVGDEMVRKMDRKMRSTRSRAYHFSSTRAHSTDNVERWLVSSWMRVVRPMRVHVTLGRRLLWWRDSHLLSDGKADVIDRFMEEPSFRPFHDRYRALCHLDTEYDLLLRRACAGNERRGRYLKRVTRLLMANFKISLDLLSSVTLHMKEDSLQQAA